MFKRKVLFLIISLVTIIGVIAGFMIIPKVTYKYYDFTKRFRVLEEQVKYLSKYLVSDLEIYQASRKTNINFSKIKKNVSFNWTEFNVPWNKNNYTQTKALTVWNDNLIVGVGGTKDIAPIVYMYDGEQWSKLEGSEKINPTGWQDLELVHVLCVHNNKLYAGIDNTVWVYDNNKEWNKVGNLNDIYPWKNNQAYSMKSHDGNLYLGVTGSARIFRLIDNKWQDVSSGLGQFSANGIYELHEHTDGILYASTISKSHNSTILKLDKKKLKWVTVGGNGINGSWMSKGFNYGMSMASYNKFLFVTLNRIPLAHGNYSSIWVYDGKEWFVVGNRKIPSIWAQSQVFNASIFFKDIFFISSGGNPAGNSRVWALNKDVWQQIGGTGINSSWGLEYPHTLSKSFRHTASEFPYRFIVWRDRLIVGFGSSPGNGALWKLKVGVSEKN